MSYATIRDAIKDELELVAGISGNDGIVQTFEPHTTRIEEFKTFFEAPNTNLINGWTISREAVATLQQSDGFRFSRTHSIIVRGRMALQTDGSTELVFQDLIDAILDAFDGNQVIWVKQPEENSQGPQVDIQETEVHGSMLVHMCEMRFEVEEFREVT